MDDFYFNKNAGAPKKPVRRNDGYEDISSFSSNSNNMPMQYEDISSHSPEEQRRKAQKPTKGNPKKAPKTNRKKPNKSDSFEDISSNGAKPKKKKNPILKAFEITIIILLILVLLIVGVGYYFIGKMNFNEDLSDGRVNPYISDSELYSSEDVTNILLLGVDAREGETVSRSDTMILVSIDKANEKIKMTSFLRDSYVEIPEHGWNKLNASATFGGVELVMNTLEYNFKVKINNYALVDFVAFEELIDAIGGVDVEITEKEANYLNKTWKNWSLTGNKLTFESGESVHLNGEEALMFSRIRKLDSDFYRTQRQRRVISGVKEKLASNPTSIFSVANAVLPLVETDITDSSMMKLCFGALFQYMKYNMAQIQIPADGTWHSEMKRCGDSLVFSIEDNTKILKNFIYFDDYAGKEDETTETTEN